MNPVLVSIFNNDLTQNNILFKVVSISDTKSEPLSITETITGKFKLKGTSRDL